MRSVVAIFLVVGAAALLLALWQIAFSRESLAGLWLVFWGITFLPILLALAAAHIWRRWRLRTSR